MADWFDHIDEERRTFIERQHMFFVATAPSSAEDGFANLSPKGRTLLKVLGPNLIGWLDYPGSGNETAKHTADNGRITLMLCSFEAAAGIVRLYGTGKAVDLDDPLLLRYREAFKDDVHPYVRQAFFVEVEKVQTSCGYAVPRMEYQADRLTLDKYADRKFEPKEIVDGMTVPGPIRPRPEVAPATF
jgi:hypothetical protein